MKTTSKKHVIRLQDISAAQFHEEIGVSSADIIALNIMKGIAPDMPKFPDSIKNKHNKDSVGKHKSTIQGFVGRYNNWLKDHLPHYPERERNMLEYQNDILMGSAFTIKFV